MNLKQVMLICGLSAALSACDQGDRPEIACEAADLVLHNTKIYTADDNNWTAEAVAVLGDKIIFVGSNTDAAKYMCGSARVMDMSGKTVFAGFTDSHQHLEQIGERDKTLSLFGIPTLKETVAAIKEFADTVRPFTG